MLHFIFETLWGWWGVAGIAVVVCAAVAYFIPSLRLAMLAVVGVVLSSASIYTKGNRDRAKLEARRKEEAVKNARAKYDKIDQRKDTPETVARRLRDGSF